MKKRLETGGAVALACACLAMTLFGATHDAVAADRMVMIEIFGASW